MTILEKEIFVCVSGTSFTHFEELGYDIPRRKGRNGKPSVSKGTKILVKVDHLPKGSSIKLTKICDIPDCGEHIPNQAYGEILRQRRVGDGKDRCRKCWIKKAAEDKNKNFFNQRIGQTNKNKYGSIMTVVEYRGSDHILVEFENGYRVETIWDQFIKGKVANPYDRSTYGVGYLGEGKYKTNMTIDGKHKQTPHYKAWQGMMKRCYDNKYRKKNPSYDGCIVCDEWHNFQNFAKWHDKNYYQIEGHRMELDKDILIKGNRVYSPDTCVFTPQRINYLFIKRKDKRKGLPIGVHIHSETGKYIGNCGNGEGKTKNLGSYTTPHDAFQAYKIFKEKIIKQVAEEYKDKIPFILYNAMITYKVEITD